MENAFLSSTSEVLKHFQVSETAGLSSVQVAKSRQKYGSNSLPEDPPTPVWQLVLEQFKDQLVIILLGSAAISFVLALFEDGDDWTAFVDPVVVSDALVRPVRSAHGLRDGSMRREG
jgi:Ca2+ transporting ATPase